MASSTSLSDDSTFTGFYLGLVAERKAFIAALTRYGVPFTALALVLAVAAALGARHGWLYSSVGKCGRFTHPAQGAWAALGFYFSSLIAAVLVILW